MILKVFTTYVLPIFLYDEPFLENTSSLITFHSQNEINPESFSTESQFQI